MQLSKHAEDRAQARGVEIYSLILIRRFGHSERVSGGAKVWIANERERREILRQARGRQLSRRKLQAVQRNFERPDPLYFVESFDGIVITIGRRTRKIRRR